MRKEWVKNMFYAHWFTIFTLRMCPGLLVFLFQIICMKHCKPWLKAQLGWKTRTPSHEKKNNKNTVPKSAFIFVSKWNCEFFKIHSLRLMRRIVTRGLSWDSRHVDVIASWFRHKQGWNPGFTSTMLIVGYSGLWCWVLLDVASSEAFQPYHLQWTSTIQILQVKWGLSLSLAFIKTSTLTWISCRFLEINTFL